METLKSQPQRLRLSNSGLRPRNLHFKNLLLVILVQVVHGIHVDQTVISGIKVIVLGLAFRPSEVRFQLAQSIVPLPHLTPTRPADL